MENILNSLWLMVSTPPPVPANLSHSTVEELRGFQNTLLPYKDADLQLLFWATVFVTIGVLMEFPEIAHVVDKGIRKFRKLPDPGDMKLRWELFVAIGWVLVAGGLALEWFGDARINSVYTDLDRINQAIIEDTQGLAILAEGSAEQARISAKKADEHAGDAARKAIVAGKEADRLGNEISMVQYFSTSRAVHDQKSLKAQLEPFRGQPVVFRSYKNDGDGYITCGELAFVAQQAGMIPTNQCGEWPFPDGSTMADGTVFPITGLFVSGPNDDSMLSLEQVLSRVSPAFGAGAGPFGKKAQRPPMFIVFVGKKSDVFVGDTAQTRDAERRAAAMRKAQKRTPKH
jgi:hypothetical protein